MNKQLEAYLKKHPNVEFKFSFNPKGTSMSDEKPWKVLFKAGLDPKVPSRCGYACHTFEELIEHLVNELP